MKKILSLGLLLVIISSCTTSLPITATSNKLGSNKGEACLKNLFLIIPLETDASIYKAAQNGNISEITTVDHEGFFSFIYNSSCTIVRGNK